MRTSEARRMAEASSVMTDTAAGLRAVIGASFQIWKGRQCGDEPLRKGAEFVWKGRQDIVDKDAMAGCVQQIPSRRIQTIACRFELALCLENASQVLRVDWDHEHRTDEAPT